MRNALRTFTNVIIKGLFLGKSHTKFYGGLFFIAAFIGVMMPSLFAQNVGIGTATPASKLSVNGNLSIGAGYAGTAAPANGAIIEGYVGIGTTTPLTRLHLSSDGAILAQGTAGAGVGIPVTGAGVRLMWIPRLAAFRAGLVTGNQWDVIGYGSFAGGEDNHAPFSFNFIGAGRANTIFNSTIDRSHYACIVGGELNSINRSPHSFIGGGFGNAIFLGYYSFIGGGRDHFIIGEGNFIGGGKNNAFTQFSNNLPIYGVIVGGANNNISVCDNSVIIGGNNNVIATAAQFPSTSNTILGGSRNTIGGITSYGIVGGLGMNLNNGTGTFVFGNDPAASSTVSNQVYAFLIGPYGNTYRVGINLSAPTYALQLPNDMTATIGKAQANAWDIYSDARIKSKITEIKNPLDIVSSIKPRYYFQHNSKFTPEGNLELSDKGEYRYGFIAQELEKVLPEAVTRPEDPSKALYGVNYDMLVPVLTAAIQEQQELIEKQQNIIQRQQQQIDEILKRLEAIENR